jgi:hypothetical protein
MSRIVMAILICHQHKLIEPSFGRFILVNVVHTTLGEGGSVVG